MDFFKEQKIRKGVVSALKTVLKDLHKDRFEEGLHLGSMEVLVNWNISKATVKNVDFVEFLKFMTDRNMRDYGAQEPGDMLALQKIGFRILSLEDLYEEYDRTGEIREMDERATAVFVKELNNKINGKSKKV